MAIVGKVPRERRKRRGPRRLKSIRLLPSLLTLGNLLCGFAAIHFALKGMYEFGAGLSDSGAVTGHSALLERMLPSLISVGAGLLIVGMIFDGFDGLVARMVRNTTDFGGQLDSLADMTTCGVAPAVLLVALLDHELHNLGVNLSPLSSDIMGRVVWVSAAIYVACAAVRLARFNVEHASIDYDPGTFRGLPSPGAAGIIVAFIIFLEQAREFGVALPGGTPVPPVSSRFVVYATPLIALGSGLLMVSRIRYRKLSVVLQGRRPFGQLVAILLLFAIFWAFKAVFLVVFAFGYGLSGPIEHYYHKLRDKKPPPGEAAIPLADAKTRRSG